MSGDFRLALLDSACLPSFIERLRLSIPRTLSLIGIAHHINQRKLKGKIYTNNWPDFTAVVCQASTSPGLLSVIELTCYATTTCDFEDILRMLREETSLLSPDWKVIRLKCDTDLSIFLTERLSTHSLQVDTVFNGINYYMPIQKQRIPEYPVGYILKPLEEHHADFISRYWEWIFNDSDKIIFFKGLIKHFHSVGMFTSDNPDQPIAWCLQYGNARLAHLYVMEEYRRKGFASLLYQHICEKIMADGLFPEVVVDEHNRIGIDLVEKLGFIRSVTHIGLMVKHLCDS